MVEFSSAPEEEPKTQLFGDGKTTRTIGLCGSRSSRKSPSVVVQASEGAAESLLLSIVKETGVSADCWVGMLGERRRELPFRDSRRKDGDVEVTGFREAQPAMARVTRISGNARAIARVRGRGFGIFWAR